MSFWRDLRFALRSLAHARSLWITVAFTLALGIGANAAIFSVVRGVLLRPLANRDEDRLIYLRQSAPGIGVDNSTFSVPEIKDIGGGLSRFVNTGLREYEALAVEGRRTIDDIDRVVRSIGQNPSQVIFGSKPSLPEYHGGQ